MNGPGPLRLSIAIALRCTAACAWLAAGCGATPQSAPNFLVIVADDLGSGEVGAYGNPDAVTPNIDRLAADGIRFTRFYTAGDVCAPTRASLLTGSYPQRFGFREPRSPHRGVTQAAVTLPGLMKAGGYATHRTL